jgi:outer membrane murein-binding lipoprotein Lpp
MTLVNAFGDIALDTSVQSVVTEIGAIADASVTAGATGSLSAKIRRLSADLNTLLGYSDGVETSLTAIDANAGAAADAAVAAGATGSLSAKIRRLSTDLNTLLGYMDGVEASLTSIDAGTAAGLGQTTMSASVPVAIASDQTPPAYTLVVGERAGATSATQFASVAAKWVKVKAQYDNAGRVYIGVSSVTKSDGTTDTTSGWQLNAGEETPWLPLSNLSQLYLICDNTGDDTNYMALT